VKQTDETQALPSVPTTAGLLATISDLQTQLGFVSRTTREAILAHMAPEENARANIRDDAEALRRRLLGDHASPLEELLVDRIVVTWLQVHHADYSHGRRNDLSPAQQEQVQRWQDRAQRRFLQAAKALAQVRKLEVNIQFNLAEKQINVMGMPSTAAPAVVAVPETV
jgi:hypothetical protein